jgi:UDP-N-acetylmuramoyl-tripeptide--D-alanyl-D-alanine ligase
MIRFSIEDLVAATEGKLAGMGESTMVSGISTDSRQINAGDLFIPLIGENFDGHDYIQSAFDKGAAATLTQRESLDFPGKTVIFVEDTLKALQSLAQWYRSIFDIPFIGITGSVGKTSTKEMVACAIGERYNVLKNEGNLNNEIGLPLTMFNLDTSHEAAVVEMGMSAVGEIKALASIVRPKVGIITNIGISHIENLGSRQNILKAKLELLDGLQPDGLLILNGDDIMLSGVKDLLSCRTVSYGLEEGVDYQAYNVQSRGEFGIDFSITVGEREYAIHLPVPGVHNVYNALAAVAAGLELGVPMQDLQAGISHFRPGKMRLNILKAHDMTIINDTYNASPQSMYAALDVLVELQSTRKIAVLGDMLELGDWSERAHVETGIQAARKKPDMLVTVGKEAANIIKGAIEAGFPPNRTIALQKNQEAVEYLRKTLQPGDAVLVKGSRSMKMEQIVQALTEE